jgi:hypothetical protein
LARVELALAISAGAGFAAWDYWFKDNPGYPAKVMKQADELQERLLSFDSHITVPMDFGTAGNEADKDGSGQFDLIKTGRGRLSGAALTIFGWPEIWNGENAPHRPTAGFVEEARFEQETRYKIISTMVRDFPNQVAIAYTPEIRACMAKASSPSSSACSTPTRWGTTCHSWTCGQRAACACSASATWATTPGPTRRGRCRSSMIRGMPWAGCRTSASKRCSVSTTWA